MHASPCLIRAGLWALLLASFAVALAACDGCADDADTVPFKRDAPGDKGTKKGTEQDDREPSEALPEAHARVHDGGPELKLGETQVSLAAARASLSLDLDDDGAEDALVWAGGADDTPLSLWLLRGDADGFAAPQQVDRSSVSLPEGCELDQARFELVGPDKAGVVTQLSCEPSDPPPMAVQLLWVGLGESPRVLERVGLRGASDESAPTLASLSASDEDGDGHTDAHMHLRTGGPAEELRITWLDRPSGLAREPDEPERTLQALASAAEQQLASDPAGAGRAAEAVLTLHAQLCREPGEAVLSVADVWGLRCGRSKAAGLAGWVHVRALTEAGQLVEALQALSALEGGHASVDTEKRQQAVKALEERARTSEWKLTPMPPVALPAAQPALRPAIRLLDGRLWVGTRPPRMWQLATREPLSILAVPELPRHFADPSGHYRVRHVDRDCRGRLLRLTAEDGTTVRARITDHPPAPGCALRLPVPDAGSLRVLGWAPQGVVLSDAEGALLVPLDSQARPTDVTRRIEATVPLPAPLPAGRAAASGRCHVRPTAHGVLLAEHGRNAQPRLIRPEGWESLQGDAREAVVDESCKRLAVATSSRVYLIEHEDAPAPPTMLP